MKKYLFILIAMALFEGCTSEDRTQCAKPGGVFVHFTVHPNRMTTVTRTTDEETIRDLNLYLYNDNGDIVLHLSLIHI